MTEASSPPFDALKGALGPTEMFGPTLEEPSHSATADSLRRTAGVARRRIREVFEVEIKNGAVGVAALDEIIASMWNDDWSPKPESINLFATDFGALLAESMAQLPNLVLVFRSQCELDHVSLWDRHLHMEYFPFHKVMKALSVSEGESLIQMFKSASGPGGTDA